MIVVAIAAVGNVVVAIVAAVVHYCYYCYYVYISVTCKLLASLNLVVQNVVNVHDLSFQTKRPRIAIYSVGHAGVVSNYRDNIPN